MDDIIMTVGLDPKDAIDRANDLQKSIKKIFDKTTGKSFGKDFDKQLNNIKKQMAEASRYVEKLKRDMFTEEHRKIGNTPQYQKELDTLKQLQKELAKYKKQATKKNLSSVDAAQLKKDIRSTKGKIKYREKKIADLEKNDKAYLYAGKTSDKYKELTGKLGDATNRMVMLVSSARELTNEAIKANSSWSKFKERMSNLKKNATKVVSAFKKIGTPIAKSVSGLTKLTGKMLGLGKATDKHNMSLKKMINQVLKYGLGIRSLFILWRKLRAYTADALKLMATQFEEVDADVSALMNSFNQMKLSFGTMAQPLMHALRPALVYIIELITRATTALANFFAILTGQKYIYKAQKANDSYADSIKGVGSAAKEANKELAEYDNLLVIDQPKDGSGGGGSGAADGLTGTFEKTLAESDFAKQLKDAINRGDWEGVGGLFANKLNIITKTFDNWINKKFRPKAVTWASRIGRILNGLTEGWDSNLTGKTIADTLNAILDTTNTFFKTYKFKRLGEKVGGLIKGFFDNMDPVLLGETLANKINAVIDFATGLVDTTPWEEVGDKLGTALKTWFETVKWEDLGADLQKLASGILTSLAHFIQTSKLGTTVGTAINKFLNGIDFAQLAEDLSDCVKSILGAIADLIETIDWYEVGKAIADFLTHIDWIGLIVELTKVALALIKGLAKALAGLVTNPEAIADIATALLAIFAVKKIWKGITGLFKTNVASSITSGVTSASKSSGLISKVSGALTKFFETTVGKVVGAIGAGYALFEFGSSLAGSIGSVIATAFGDDEMANEYQKLSQAPTQYVVGAIGEAIQAGKETCETTGLSVLNTAWSDMWGEIFTGGSHKDALELANQSTQEIYDEVNETMQRAKYSYDVLGLHELISDEDWEKFKNGCDNYVEEIENLSNAIDNVNNKKLAPDLGTYTDEEGNKVTPVPVSTYLPPNVKEFLEQKEILDEIKPTVDEIMTLPGDLQTFGESVVQAGQSVTDAGGEIEEAFYHMSDYIPPSVKEMMETTATNMVEPLENVPDEVGKTGQSALQSIEAPFEDNVKNDFTTYVTDIEDTFQNLPEKMSDKSIESLHKIEEPYENGVVSTFFTEQANDMTGAFDEVPNDMVTMAKSSVDGIKMSFTQDSLTDHFIAVKENIETPFKELPTFFNDTFKQSWNEAESAFSSGSTTFGNFNSKLSEGMSNTINGLIDGLNGAVSSPLRKIQEIIEKFKNVKIGANSLFSNLPSFSNIPSIPRLAQGAVIPPNREFLATLGDQTSGTNIETPLATMVQAFKTALSEMGGSSNNQNIVLQLDGRTVAQCVWDEEDKRYKQTGRR